MFLTSSVTRSSPSFAAAASVPLEPRSCRKTRPLAPRGSLPLRTHGRHSGRPRPILSRSPVTPASVVPQLALRPTQISDLWEDPRDGYSSEFDEEEEEEEEEDTASSTKTSATEYDELVKEVELLLHPEERAILQENETPVLAKISTMKWSPLHTLTLSGQLHCMDELIKSGTYIDSVDKDGFTALHKAVIGKKEAVISHLLRKGANPHVTDRDGATPLHYAVQVCALQTVKLLIKYKVDVNAADKDGWTPLHVAMQSRCRDVAKVLLINDADKRRRNKDGKTPLDLCLCYGKDFKSYDLAKLLKLVPANRDL